mgnify:CR=1
SERQEAASIRSRVFNSTREYLFNIRLDGVLTHDLNPNVKLPQSGKLEFELVVLSSEKQSSSKFVSTDFSM